MANIADGNAFVAERDIERVRRLLALAEELDFDPAVVQTRNGGYEVPIAIADAYEKEEAEAAKSAAKETTAKTTTKTTARKAASK